MRGLAPLIALPTSLLILIAGDTVVQARPDPQLQWNEGDLPQQAGIEWEDEAFVLPQHEDIRRRLVAAEPPSGVRKMSSDEGEKFFLDYWIFDRLDTSSGMSVKRERDDEWASLEADGGNDLAAILELDLTDDLLEYTNSSGEYLVRPPILPHLQAQEQLSWFSRFFRRDVLRARQFQCPTNTTSCASIDRPNSCCANGETCQIITDTGLGDVGCCPQGQDCGGSVSQCQSGYTACQNSSDVTGGGCCIPGYVCVGIGCGPDSSFTSTVVVTATPVTVTASPSSTTTSTSTSTSTSSSSSSSSSPSSSSSSSSSSTSTAPAAPFRPTSDSSTTSTSTTSPSSEVTTTTTSSVSGTLCPTGFYMCSAYYLGGCCRVGRNCDTTDCPSPSSTNVVVSNGVTIVIVPTGTESVSSASAGAASTGTSTPSTTVTTTTQANLGSGSCASGWFSCPASARGGCCPDGYACGSATCSPTLSGIGTTDVGKIAPNGGASFKEGMKGWCGVGGAWGIGVLIGALAFAL